MKLILESQKIVNLFMGGIISSNPYSKLHVSYVLQNEKKKKKKVAVYLFAIYFSRNEVFRLTQSKYTIVLIANNLKLKWLFMYQCICVNILTQRMSFISPSGYPKFGLS